MNKNSTSVALILSSLFTVGAMLPASAADPRLPADKPTLIVAIAVDQFSAGIFDQYRGRYEAGLRRMIDAGVVFPNGYQSHAATETCPGHSTLLTGKHPSGTGIIANEWLGADGKPMYCLYDAGTTVPGRPAEPRGPANLRTSTLGEWLKAQNPASKVVAVSGKDRGAINMAGHNPDAVFWWDDELGFNTYVPPGADANQRLEPVKALNDSITRRWKKQLPTWKPLDASCARLNSYVTYDNTWNVHHHVPADWKRANPDKPFRDDKAFKRWVRASPTVDELTLELATSLLNRYKLGRGGAPDLLAISLSATDYIGHRYGNEGPEMCDQMAHLDQNLGAFFKTLDAAKVRYVVVLSADHGGLDAAERVRLKGFPAERMTADVADEVNKHLGVNAFAYLSYGLYFLPTPALTPEERQKLSDSAVKFLNQQPYVTQAFAKADILKLQVRPGVPPDEMRLEERFAESVDPQRSADILIAFKPYSTLDHVDSNGFYIAGHGTPWNYDRRVPIVFWRPGLPGYEQYLPIETVDIAPTLAGLVGVAHPPVDGRCIDLDSSAANTCSH
ncbi:MAG: alkaline phosphatase family protein [Proteobacteria bacterium]|nr:alkaline phosphatase family protein [Pseudomonadota bacterium]